MKQDTEAPLVHLLIPKEFKVYCRSKAPSSDMTLTVSATKATCANCLTKFMRSKGRMRRGQSVRVSTIPGRDPETFEKACARLRNEAEQRVMDL